MNSAKLDKFLKEMLKCNTDVSPDEFAKLLAIAQHAGNMEEHSACDNELYPDTSSECNISGVLCDSCEAKAEFNKTVDSL